MNDPAAVSRSRASPLMMLGVGVVLACMVLKVCVGYDPFPGWDGDPLEVPVPILGLTPMSVLVCDAVMMLGATVVLGGAARRWKLGMCEFLLFVAGATVALAHALVIEGGSLENLVLASSWCSALMSGLAIRHAARDDRVLRLAAGACLGVVAALAAKSVLQVFIEHPRTLEMFRADRERILTSHGWAPGSPMALTYERRLSQADASAWFGLANVLATFGAGATVTFVGLAAPLMTKARSAGWASVAVVAGLACALTLLVLTGAKGGYGATLLGLAVLGVCALAAKHRVSGLVAKSIGAAAIAMPLLAVVARGLIGERIGELSLFFRWFYMQGAAQIFSQNWLLGVGPADFKDAYLIAKPAISPEDVSSPHSVLFDYAATLGIAGVAWGGLLVLWAVAAGRNAVASAAPDTSAQRVNTPDAPTFRPEARVLALVIAVPMLIAAWLELPIASVESTLVRFIGIAGGAAVGIGVMWVMQWRGSRTAMPALGAAALAIVAHAQIELTPVSVGAAAWFMIVLGAAAAARGTDRPRAWRGAVWIGATLLITCAFVSASPRVVKWELHLRAAHQKVTPFPWLVERYRALIASRWTRTEDGDTPEKLAADVALVASRVGLPRGGTSAKEVSESLTRLYLRLAGEAAADLHRAQETLPTHFPTRQAISGLKIAAATRAKSAAQSADAAALAAEGVLLADEAAAAEPRAAAFAWAGNAARARAEIVQDKSLLADAIPPWTRAAELSPHEPLFPAYIAEASATLGRTEEARIWAERAIDRHLNTRLDPMRGLPREQLARMEVLAGRKRVPEPP